MRWWKGSGAFLYLFVGCDPGELVIDDADPVAAAPTGAQLLVSWHVVREGVSLSCTELEVTHVEIRIYLPGDDYIVLVPCDDGYFLTDPLPLGIYELQVAVLVPPTDWLIFSSGSIVTLSNLGEVTHAPVRLELLTSRYHSCRPSLPAPGITI